MTDPISTGLSSSMYSPGGGGGGGAKFARNFVGLFEGQFGHIGGN